jgi:hypothetical protein
MKRLPGSLLIAASFLAMAAFASAQQRPNFSGTWVFISPADQAGLEETIVHTATELSFGHESEGGGHNFSYNLDGSESRHVMTSHGEDIVSVAKVAWEGDTLVIHQTTRYPDGRKLEMRSTMSLNAAGELVREASATMDGVVQPPIRVIARKKS